MIIIKINLFTKYELYKSWLLTDTSCDSLKIEHIILPGKIYNAYKLILESKT